MNFLLCSHLSFSSVKGTDLGPDSGSCSASNGMDEQLPSSSCSPALSHVINGDDTPNSTPVHQPSDSDPESRTGEVLGNPLSLSMLHLKICDIWYLEILR